MPQIYLMGARHPGSFGFGPQFSSQKPLFFQLRIRAAFDRLAGGYRRGDVLELPVAVKLATAQKPDPLCD